MDADQPGSLDDPRDPEAKKSFHEALAYAAKLYDLEGLNKQDDNEAQRYFKKALTRTAKLSDKMLHSWVEIHLAELALRLGLKPATHYTDALEPFKALNLDSLDPPSRSDSVNLMLTCYYHLGRLGESAQNKGPNVGVKWYQSQLDLAEKYGSSVFQVLAHERLAYISLLEGLTQTSSSDQSKSFQNAYEHAKKAWEINKSFSDEGSGVIEPNVLVELMINIVDGIIKLSNVNSSPLIP